MKSILHHLFEHKTLQKAEAQATLMDIAQGKYNPSQIAAFLTVFIMRGIRVEELEGFRDAMLDLCIPIDLSDYDPIDLCGTGGDGKDTFNISTLASFITAAAGVFVAKHGNYGVSSISGSSNMMEHFGYTFTNDRDALLRKMEKTGICFLHAPLFHPAMKQVAPIRRELGVKTFFNMLGPMVNPAFVRKQVVGVFNLELARIYGYLYQQGNKKFAILHNIDGYDEISLTSELKIIDNESERRLLPQDLGFHKWQANDLLGGNTVQASADIFMRILNGEGTQAQNEVVIANAALAIQVGGKGVSWSDAKEQAAESLFSGKAKKTFISFINN